MGLLNGGISAIFGAALGGLYLDGILHRDGVNPVYDDEGNITGYAGADDMPIKVQRDACSYSMRQSEGYSEGDVMLIILASSLAGTKVTTDMQATDGAGDRWTIKSHDLDAASSHWICRGRVA
ncbi:hypothetical protein [Sphingobium sp. CCH11-B1]|uniref:hypothetical protein n=1 Tax=Sphingobium sp. CCH11-B1 TaxID=1768781 RepID=UPI0008299F68|nr:hypothetical protein [Sphingobium sp. CCH11-B1]